MGDRYSDETLMAYVDGELQPDERKRLEQALALDEPLRRRLAVFERTGRSLGDLYARVLDEPVPEHLQELVRGAGADGGEPGLAQRLAARLRESVARFSRPQLAWATASAAGLFALGLGLGLVLQGSPSAPPGDAQALIGIEDNHLWARGPLRDALERVPSGTSTSWSGGSGGAGTVVPVLTFKDKTGRFCREYAVAGTKEASAVGIACRSGAGRWSIEIHTAQATGDAATVFRPAEGGGIERLNALMTEMSAGEALGADQEEAAIRAGWR